MASEFESTFVGIVFIGITIAYRAKHGQGVPCKTICDDQFVVDVFNPLR